MDSLDERLKMARARNELADFNDDTAVEEELAALYLCVSPKKLGELRANGGGPVFVKPQDPKAAGRNQPVSYVMRELRKWRESMSAGSNLEIARRQGLVGWVQGVEPFWIDKRGLVVESALDQTSESWPDMFLQVIAEKLNVVWSSPRSVLMRQWRSVSAHTKFAEEYRAVLKAEESAVFASLEATTLFSEISPKGLPKSN